MWLSVDLRAIAYRNVLGVTSLKSHSLKSHLCTHDEQTRLVIFGSSGIQTFHWCLAKSIDQQDTIKTRGLIDLPNSKVESKSQTHFSCTLVFIHLYYGYRKFHINKFVQNSLCCNMGMIIFDLLGYGGCQRLKTPLGGQKWHEGVDLLKKVFNKSFSTTSKSPQRVQSDLSCYLKGRKL